MKQLLTLTLLGMLSFKAFAADTLRTTFNMGGLTGYSTTEALSGNKAAFLPASENDLVLTPFFLIETSRWAFSAEYCAHISVGKLRPGTIPWLEKGSVWVKMDALTHRLSLAPELKIISRPNFFIAAGPRYTIEWQRINPWEGVYAFPVGNMNSTPISRPRSSSFSGTCPAFPPH